VLFGFVFVSLTFISPAVAATASFQGLGDLPGGIFSSGAAAVSADGSTVVGAGNSASGQEAFRWTSASGMVGLGDLPGSDFLSFALGVSADGSVVVGASRSSSGSLYLEAFRWTSGGGMVGMGNLSEYAWDVSADGSVIVGDGGSDLGREAFRWTSASGMVGLGDLPGGYFSSEAHGVSADGSVVVGRSDSGLPEAFHWTSASGMIGLGDLAGGMYTSEAYDVSADGSTVVGWASSDSVPGGAWEAFRWTSASGMVGLGFLPGGNYSVAYDVSSDGSVVVGFSRIADFSFKAFIWDPNNGMRNLKEVLVNDHGLDLTGWTLTRARGISDDGLTIVGTGYNPSGDTEAWIVKLDREPLVFAIVIGVNDAADLAGDIDAENVYSVLEKLPNWADPVKYGNTTGPFKLINSSSGIKSQIESYLTNMKLQEDDAIVFYFSGHGGTLTPTGPETLVHLVDGNDNTADEVLQAGSEYISDEYLTDLFLNDLRLWDVKKIFLLDACHSGGFEGTSLLDDGDLENLIGRHLLLAAAPEEGYSYSALDGTGLWTNEILPWLSFGITISDYIFAINQIRDNLVAQYSGQQLPVRPLYQPGETRLFEFNPVISYSDDWGINEPVFGLAGDLNGDYRVDLRDFAKLAKYWQMNEESVDIFPIPNGDGIVDLNDLALFTQYWLTGTQ